ncbi:MBL fold metallo-hydrolase [Aquincola sp. S2]|uniref:MBL fold metallo-hydrolase n=1 Tax=Pseudaquabacterium terrae TaxID=2732868 RepID=A0ABX2EBY1_9BURK|nr:MBL fold metallo-hydrolase [Aquabacterium terrae]NRF65862.1 MBL fold metallo-hydrolase [Aquabacterium terrae]
MPRNPFYDPTQPHHRPDGFRNPGSDEVVKSLAQVLRWRLDARRDGLPRPPSDPIPTARPDLTRLQAYAAAHAADPADHGPSITWVGHATVLAQLGGLSVLTDPIFSERASPLPGFGPKRHQAPGLAPHELPHVDLVLISHNHYDHLDDASVRALASQAGGAPLFVVPLGLKAWLAARGITRVAELDWWQSVDVGGGTEVVLLPAQHWSARGLNDRMLTLWGGYAVLAGDCHLFYPGDTGYSRDFARVREHFAPRQQQAAGGGFDMALIPIGAYAPRWFMSAQHVDVDEALKICADVGAKRMVGVHWGTFALSDEALDEPPRVLRALREERGLSEDQCWLMAIGETRLLPSRRAEPR